MGAPCGGGAGAPPFAGPGLVGRVGPVRRHRRVLGGLARRCSVLGGLVGVRWRQWVLVRVGLGLGGPLCLDVGPGGYGGWYGGVGPWW